MGKVYEMKTGIFLRRLATLIKRGLSGTPLIQLNCCIEKDGGDQIITINSALLTYELLGVKDASPIAEVFVGSFAEHLGGLIKDNPKIVRAHLIVRSASESTLVFDIQERYCIRNEYWNLKHVQTKSYLPE